MTIVEKIIAAHSGRRVVEAGEELFVKPDLAVGSEIIFPQVLKFLKDLGGINAGDDHHIALVNGHLVATREAAVGTLVDALDRFATELQIPYYFQIGRSGGCHSLLAEQGLVSPGDFIIGSDQHITAYGAMGAFATGVGGLDLAAAWATRQLWFKVPPSARIHLTGTLPPMVTIKDLTLYILWKLGSDGAMNMAVEFCGPALENIGIEERFIIANLIVETGAVNAWFPIDGQLEKYMLSSQTQRRIVPITPDRDSVYTKEFEFNLSDVQPMVSMPFNPVNGCPVADMSPTQVNQVIIGSCTNSSLSDFRQVAAILANHTIAENVRLLLYPASHKVIREILDGGLGLFFTAKGAQMSPPTCQPCLGSGASALREGEVGVYTVNRNYRGRHGHPDAKVFLAGPMVAAASAVTGELTDPRELNYIKK